MRKPLPFVSAIFAISVLTVLSAISHAQQAPPAPAPPPTARSLAPIDITGYWVAVITEDWRWRMMTPPKGDYASLPLNNEGRRVADTWDLAKDESAGLACKPYGIGNIMRMPGRMHITWQDDNTLKAEFDAGTQTRLLHFEAKPAFKRNSKDALGIKGGKSRPSGARIQLGPIASGAKQTLDYKKLGRFQCARCSSPLLRS